MKRFDDDDSNVFEEAVTQASANLLESKTAQLADILGDKLEEAFDRQTSALVLHDVAKIVSEYSPIDLAYAAPRLPTPDRIVLYDNLYDLSAQIEFLICYNW